MFKPPAATKDVKSSDATEVLPSMVNSKQLQSKLKLGYLCDFIHREYRTIAEVKRAFGQTHALKEGSA